MPQSNLVAIDTTTWDVLVVDNEPFNLELVQDALAFFNIRCETAESGAIALEKFVCQKPNLVLLDLSMPGLDGWQTKDAMRVLSPDRRVVAIAFTAHAMPNDRKRALESGFDGYLVKPIEIERIVGEIRTIIDNVMVTAPHG